MAKKINELIRKGAIQEKKERLERLEIDIDGLVKEINYALFISDGIKSIDIDLAELRFTKLKKAVAEYNKLQGELEELK